MKKKHCSKPVTVAGTKRLGVKAGVIAMHLLRLIFQGVYAFTDAFEQAVAHFSHNAFGAALCGLMPAVTEVNGCTGDQFVGLVGDVAVLSGHSQSDSSYLLELAGVCTGCGGAQQFFDFVAVRKDGLQ